MNKLKTIFATAIILSGTLFLAKAQEQPASSIKGQNWELLPDFSDEFDNTAIDWQDKWSKSSNLPNVSAWKWDNTNNAAINNGVVELTMRHNENNVSDGGTYFKSGIIQSQAKTCYGYYEARIKGSAIPETSNPSSYKYDWYGRGCCPAFWLWSFDESQPVHNGKAVRYSEIDIVEIQQFDYYQNTQYRIKDLDLNLHTIVDGNWVRPKDDPDKQKNHFLMTEDPTLGFHTYAVENRPDSIFWYVDGELVAAQKNLYWHLDMNVTVSLGVRVPFVKFSNNAWSVVNPENDARAKAKLDALYDETVNPDPAGTTKMHLDYIRTWKALPSLWFDMDPSYDNQVDLIANIGFQPGTGFNLSSGLSCKLVEKNEAGNTV
ncbi:MAG: family 16 glycosylhydrolase, partial [Bacteroidales bacterium]|nr:family 16 glycosylhydrolase [Bacteroidales bacterium]